MMREILHGLARRHASLSKEGVGEIVLCSPWIIRRHGTEVWFRPDLDGAGWHKVPQSHIALIAGAQDAYDAMRRLREETAA